MTRTTTIKQPSSDEDLFAGALAMPAAERWGYIARACAEDVIALQRLTALLDSFDDAVNFVAERCVEEIGAYRLLRELGEGGCGIAYLAEQLAPVKRHVALKIIKPGMDTKAVVARFEAERQLLALMDHPNVAKVFDAGSTPAGRPYFVMELVRGLRITEYGEQLRSSIAERLQLFMQVCCAGCQRVGWSTSRPGSRARGGVVSGEQLSNRQHQSVRRYARTGSRTRTGRALLYGARAARQGGGPDGDEACIDGCQQHTASGG